MDQGANIVALDRPAMTAGCYLRLRREAAGLSIEQLADRCANGRLGRQFFANLLMAAEADREAICSPLVLRPLVRGGLRFDQEIYQNLVLDLPHPSICRACGCSWHDACADDTHGPCSWTDASETLCTACERAGKSA